MTDRRKSRLISITRRIRDARKALDDAVRSGVQSASLSSSGNASSYTRINLKELREYIASLERARQTILLGCSRSVAPDFDLC